METLIHYYRLVEQCIGDLGFKSANRKDAKPGQWSFVRGTATVWVDVWQHEGEADGYIQIMSPIMPQPKQNLEAFYQEILELNFKLGVSFSLYQKFIYMKTIRTLAGLGKIEVISMIEHIARLADEYDEYLKDKYLRGLEKAGKKAE